MRNLQDLCKQLGWAIGIPAIAGLIPALLVLLFALYFFTFGSGKINPQNSMGDQPQAADSQSATQHSVASGKQVNKAAQQAATSLNDKEVETDVPSFVDAQIAAAHQYGESALSNLLLVNAGSIVAILTFLGHMYSTDNKQRLARAVKLTGGVTPAIKAFAFGTLLTVVLGLSTYVGMISLVKSHTGANLRWLEVLNDSLSAYCVFASVSSFVVGAGYSLTALQSLAVSLSKAEDS